MKQLVIYFTVVACLLLLLPLPALKIKGRAPKQEGSVTSTTGTVAQATNKTTAISHTKTTAPKAEKQAVFQVREEDEIHTYDEKTFLRAVVTCEMPLSYSKEALKAQTVAAYTYFSRQREEAKEDGTIDLSQLPSRFIECSTKEGLKKRLGGYYETYIARLDEVIEEVHGYIIVYEGKCIEAVYHAISSGITETGETVWQTAYPYLQSVNSLGDKTAETYRVEQTYTPEEVKKAFKSVKGINFMEEPKTWFGKAKCRESGFVTEITVGGVALNGTDVRKALGLRSSCFNVSYSDNVFTFTGVGYGHGVGLSQFGAQYMAEEGASWREILQHYYTGVTIEKEKGA